MKKLMVERCPDVWLIDRGFLSLILGTEPRPTYPANEEIVDEIRCENPAGHPEAEHRGSLHDAGHHVAQWRTEHLLPRFRGQAS